MMSKLSKYLSLLLAAILLAGSLAACAIEGGDESTAETTATIVEEATVDEAAEALGAIEKVSFGGGEFVVLYADDTGWAYDEEVVGVANMGDAVGSGVINDAVFERNTKFEELCELTYVQIPRGFTQIQSLVTNDVAGGTGAYQFINIGMGSAAECAIAGVLYNYLDFTAIDYNRPWWDQGTLGFNLDGHVMFMNGAHNLVDDDMTYVLAFNKTLIEEYGVENPYATVQNGNWTLDYFRSIILPVSVDNGDGKWGVEDTYGFAASHEIGNTVFYGAGLQYVKIQPSTGEITLALDSKGLEKATSVLDMMLSMVYDEHAIYMGNNMEYDNAAKLFIEEQAMFFSENSYYLRSIAATMETDFGIVPVPKYDAAQEHYHTWAHSIGSTLCIPVNIKDPESFERILETYVILSYQHVTPAYYETLLGSRNVRDPESAEILADIFANRTYDMSQYYRSLNLADIFYNCVNNNKEDFVSSYTKSARSFDRTLDRLMKQLETKK